MFFDCLLEYFDKKAWQEKYKKSRAKQDFLSHRAAFIILIIDF